MIQERFEAKRMSRLRPGSLAQMETAIYIVNEPARAMARIRHSIDSFANAMNEPVDYESNGARLGGHRTERSDPYSGRKV
jgi:hypothetical protein